MRRERAGEGDTVRRSVQLGLGAYPEKALDLDGIDIEDIATALSDQTDYEHRWLIDPRTDRVAFWTSDLGIDGENPVEIDELDLIPIDLSRPTCGSKTWPTLPKASATARTGRP